MKGDVPLSVFGAMLVRQRLEQAALVAVGGNAGRATMSREAFLELADLVYEEVAFQWTSALAVHAARAAADAKQTDPSVTPEGKR